MEPTEYGNCVDAAVRLNRTWNRLLVPEGLVRTRFLLSATLLALLAAVLAIVAPFAAKQLGASWQPLDGWLRVPVATFLMMIVWATIYYVLPNVTQTVRLIMPGSVAGVLVWLAATLGFSFYVSHFGNFGITYGALGGIVILLVWMWFSSLALMLGAEINAVLRHPAR